jgi:hypothetical protein
MEERGGEEEGAAQGRSGRAGRGRTRPHGARGARPSLPGRGARGALEHGRRRLPPPPPSGRGKGAPSGRGNGGGRGTAAGEGEGRVGEALHGRENEKTRNPRCNNGGFSPGKKTLAGAERKSVDCRRFGDPIDEPNALRRSPRRDERSGTLGFGRRCTDWE